MPGGASGKGEAPVRGNKRVGSREEGGRGARECLRLTGRYMKTFLGGRGQERSGDDSIWDLVLQFNMYDPMSLILAGRLHPHASSTLPALEPTSSCLLVCSPSARLDVF